MFPVCYGGYLRVNEDKTSFSKPGWKPVDNSTNKDELFRLCPKPWRYQSAEDMDTVPKWGQFSFYPGGGFVVDLGYENSTGFTVIETLQSNDWLDRQTRAIILEFSSFNPSVNLLCMATYFFEVEASGYSVPFTRTEVISLDSAGAGSQLFYLICVLFFIIFVALYLGRECYRLYKQRSRYFKSLLRLGRNIPSIVFLLGCGNVHREIQKGDLYDSEASEKHLRKPQFSGSHHLA